ncbi:MAG: DinB family protein [Proteobacteria bacterium]|nr:DinB family protein [Pseudomonadota bacterium]
MNLERYILQLPDQAQVIQSLCRNIPDEQARWKPDPGSWSILEVINHLLDEEREDFRVRLDIMLHHPEQPWPAIDPAGWVLARRYNQRLLSESLDAFMQERQASLKWLAQLSNPNWQAVTQAPWGPIRAGDMLAAWVAHDLLHTRQLVELRWAYTTSAVLPFRVNYAGDW